VAWVLTPFHRRSPADGSVVGPSYLVAAEAPTADAQPQRRPGPAPRRPSGCPTGRRRPRTRSHGAGKARELRHVNAACPTMGALQGGGAGRRHGPVPLGESPPFTPGRVPPPSRAAHPAPLHMRMMGAEAPWRRPRHRESSLPLGRRRRSAPRSCSKEPAPRTALGMALRAPRDCQPW
jgi:hypothetical protein